MADYTGSKFAVAVDTCSFAIFLCCKYMRVKTVTIPKHTHLSVPCSIIHADGKVKFEDIEWSGAYQLKPYPIYDCACRLKKGMHQSGHWCLSFENRKHISIGRGGMILTNDPKAVEWFKLARYHGRGEVPMKEAVPKMIGWNGYMDPDRAAKGMTLLSIIEDDPQDLKFDYPDLSKFSIYT